MANNVVQLVDKNGNNVFPIAGGVADGTITSSMLASGVVNNANLTIKKNGTTVATFGANASSPVEADITTPTKTSDLTNDSGFAIISNNTTTPSSVAFVGTNNIQDGAVTADKIEYEAIPDSAFTLPTGATLGNNTSFCLFGKFVFINIIVGGLNSSGSSAFTIATLDQSYRPYSGEATLSIETDQSSVTRCEAYIAASTGYIRSVVFPQKTGMQVRIVGCYMING